MNMGKMTATGIIMVVGIITVVAMGLAAMVGMGIIHPRTMVTDPVQATTTDPTAPKE
jgi:hypothetical protein